MGEPTEREFAATLDVFGRPLDDLFDKETVAFLRHALEEFRSVGDCVEFTAEQREPFLEGAPGGFLEYENRHGRVRRIEWSGSWTVDGEVREQAPTSAEALETLN
ncbi:hypothetical protein [Streptomyces sp. bgisy126]|uniref:hypothetical protein n=1 Tax=unclassified Streptomyces TaxID=2593676 RepID=UPI003EB8AF5B